MDIGLCWYQKGTNNNWRYDLSDHLMVVIILVTMTFFAKLDTYKFHLGDEKVFNDFTNGS